MKRLSTPSVETSLFKQETMPVEKFGFATKRMRLASNGLKKVEPMHSANAPAIMKVIKRLLSIPMERKTDDTIGLKVSYHPYLRLPWMAYPVIVGPKPFSNILGPSSSEMDKRLIFNLKI